jgi:hypothetical protein
MNLDTGGLLNRHADQIIARLEQQLDQEKLRFSVLESELAAAAFHLHERTRETNIFCERLQLAESFQTALEQTNILLRSQLSMEEKRRFRIVSQLNSTIEFLSGPALQIWREVAAELTACQHALKWAGVNSEVVASLEAKSLLADSTAYAAALRHETTVLSALLDQVVLAPIDFDFWAIPSLSFWIVRHKVPMNKMAQPTRQ